jgi:hypothetical protein
VLGARDVDGARSTGAHTLTAKLVFTDGYVDVITAAFTV